MDSDLSEVISEFLKEKFKENPSDTLYVQISLKTESPKKTKTFGYRAPSIEEKVAISEAQKESDRARLKPLREYLDKTKIKYDFIPTRVFVNLNLEQVSLLSSKPEFYNIAKIEKYPEEDGRVIPLKRE